MSSRHLALFRSLSGYDKRWLRGDLIAVVLDAEHQ